MNRIILIVCLILASIYSFGQGVYSNGKISDKYIKRIEKSDSRIKLANQRSKIAILRIYSLSNKDSIYEVSNMFNIESRNFNMVDLSSFKKKVNNIYEILQQLDKMKIIASNKQKKLGYFKPRSEGIPYFSEDVVKTIQKLELVDLDYVTLSRYCEKAAFLIEQSAQFIEVVAEQFVTSTEFKKKNRGRI